MSRCLGFRVDRLFCSRQITRWILHLEENLHPTWLWWVIDLAMFEFKNRTILMVLRLSYLCGESRLHVSWCTYDRCGMADSDENHKRSRRPDAEGRGWSHRLGTRWSDGGEVGWHRVWSTPCTWRRGAWVSWLSLKTTGTVYQWFSLKITGTVSPSLDSKLVATISPSLALKSVVDGFPVWVSKPAATIWCFEPQNHRDDFLVWASKPNELQFVSCATNRWMTMMVQDTHRDLAVCFTWK
jgi:hypothetical protein